MGAFDTWSVEINISANENEMFSLPAEFHFKKNRDLHLMVSPLSGSMLMQEFLKDLP